MLDEPLGSLDRGLREELVGELRKILNEMRVTALYVTHDQDEAMALGDRMVIMQRGRIEQIGTPSEVYTHPATPFVARFLGFTNLLPARPALAGVETPLGHFPKKAAHNSAEQTLLLRPEAARIAPTKSTVGEGFHAWGENGEMALLHGRLLATGYHGSHYRVEIKATPQEGNPAGVTTMHFQLPAYQRMGSDELLHPVQLPEVGQAISLLIYTDLATLLPYPSRSD
jgi:thiamine transport system ATP-binding protein